MPSVYNQVLIQYLDKNGKPCTSFWPTIDQDSGAASAYADLAVAMQACTDCAVIAVQFQQTLIISAEAQEGPYNTIVDRVNVLTKLEDTSRTWTFGIPGPKESILKDDHVTLDLENEDVIELNAAMQAVVASVGGAAVSFFKKGYRTQAKGGEE